MVSRGERKTTHVVPTYEAPVGQCWYHFLHGDVPGHEIDFIYRPEIPQGPLTRQHVSHLARMVRNMEPWSNRACAFTIGNLSRDDPQHEPGRGAVALIFGLRIRGANDHAGRRDPPFCHAVAAVDRHLDATSLLEASLSFHRRLLPDTESRAEGSGWYPTYVRAAQNAEALPALLRAYVADFDDLPAPGPSGLGRRWTAGDATPKRVVIVHRDREAFAEIAACAARIAAVLVESDLRWTAISTGREADLLNGVSVRFVSEKDAVTEPPGTRVLRREEVPDDPRALAEELFGLRSAQMSPLTAPPVRWRQRGGEPAGGERASRDRDPATARRRSGGGIAKRSRARERALVGLGVLVALGAPVAAVMIATSGPVQRGESGAPVSAGSVAALPAAIAPDPVSAATAEPVAPARDTASPAAAKKLIRPVAAKRKPGGKKGIYDIDVPQELTK